MQDLLKREQSSANSWLHLYTDFSGMPEIAFWVGKNMELN